LKVIVVIGADFGSTIEPVVEYTEASIDIFEIIDRIHSSGRDHFSPGIFPKSINVKWHIATWGVDNFFANAAS